MAAITHFMQQLTFWQWLIFSGVLLILELLTGGGFLLWVGISAAAVGLVLFFMPTISWALQLVLFAVLALMTCIVWWQYLKKNPSQTDKPYLNQRGSQYIGKVYTLETAIDNGVGRVTIGDSSWRVEGNDVAAGARVRVTGVSGVTLLVEPADD